MTVRTIVLLALVALARADCYYNNYNQYVCDRTSNVLRIALGIAFTVLFFTILAAIIANRQRRLRRANLSYVVPTTGTAPQPMQPGSAYYASPYGAGAQPYPPQASPYAQPFDPSKGYEMGAGAPQPSYPQQAYSGYAIPPAYSPPPPAAAGSSSAPVGGFVPPPGPPPVTNEKN